MLYNNYRKHCLEIEITEQVVMDNITSHTLQQQMNQYQTGQHNIWLSVAVTDMGQWHA